MTHNDHCTWLLSILSVSFSLPAAATGVLHLGVLVAEFAERRQLGQVVELGELFAEVGEHRGVEQFAGDDAYEVVEIRKYSEYMKRGNMLI